METNREKFIEKLKTADTESFINLITGCGKCARCSNSFWDGNCTGCHKNINNSSCEEGMAQYMESRVGENLQVKYHKKYGAFRSYSHAALGRQLADILFQAGVVDKLEPPCTSWCTADDCSGCNRFWCNILDMSRKYADDLIEPYNDDDNSDEAVRARDLYKKYHGNDMAFISEILVPRIKEVELRAQADLMVQLIDQVYKEEHAEARVVVDGMSQPVELSYVDLLAKLDKDLGTDSCMPDDVKEKAVSRLNQLKELLWPYSY